MYVLIYKSACIEIECIQAQLGECKKSKCKNTTGTIRSTGIDYPSRWYETLISV